MISSTDVRHYIVTEILKTNKIEIRAETQLVQDGLLNSIALMKLIAFLSDTYGVQFEDEDYEIANFETLEAITELVQKRTRHPAGNGLNEPFRGLPTR